MLLQINKNFKSHVKLLIYSIENVFGLLRKYSSNTKQKSGSTLFYSFTIFMFLLVLCPQKLFPKNKISKTSDKTSYITFKGTNSDFTLSESGSATPLCVSSKDYPGVRLILEKYFRNDVRKVTGTNPEVYIDKIPQTKDIVIIGTIGKSSLIDELIAKKKIDVDGIKGKWETFLIQPVVNPLPGVNHALVVAGSDKRGTIYGMFDISEKIGVSPWYWWADVPVKHHKNIYVLPGKYSDGTPSVKYRGIFLNDEWPDLTNWVQYKYGFVKPSKSANTGGCCKLRT